MKKGVGDIIVLDNRDWLILTQFIYNNEKYSFVNGININTEEFSEDYCLVDSNYNKVMDEELIEKIFPLIQESLKKEMELNNVSIEHESGERNE